MRVNLMTEGPFTPAETGTLDGVEACVHCGLCLPVCPTYEEWGTSMDSPRGRLLLMKAAAEGRIPVSDKFALHMERCLVCRACETVCPSGVQFGRAMESARAVLQRTARGNGGCEGSGGVREPRPQKISSQQADDESQPASSLGVGRPDLSEVRSPGACPKVGGPPGSCACGGYRWVRSKPSSPRTAST